MSLSDTISTRAHHAGARLEQEWLWRELAQTTLPRWMQGREQAILCWGLWLLGYLEQPDHVPRLVLSRNACRQSLEQLVSSWSTAVDREERRAAYQGESLRGQSQIDDLLTALNKNQAFQAMRREDPLGVAAWQTASQPRRQSQANAIGPPVNPGVKAYRYPDHSADSPEPAGSRGGSRSSNSPAKKDRS